MRELQKQKSMDKTENKFRDIADDIMESAVKELKGEGTVLPRVFFFTDEGKIYSSLIPWADRQGKFQARADAVLLAKKLEAKRLIFLADAFVSDINGPRPSEAPNQKEVICLIGEDGNDIFGILQEYRRKRKGKRIKMGKRHEIENAEGVFTGILQD
jgi:hypothetical protein